MKGRLGIVAVLAACLLAAASPARAAPWPRFATFGWLAPPPERTDSLHIGDYARAGFNVLLPAWRDSGRVEDTRRRLDLAQQFGLGCIVWDRRLREVNPDDPATLPILDAVVATWRDHPALLAYYLGDEPTPERIVLVAKLFARLRERDPEHPGWNNLPGRGGFPTHEAFMAYMRSYVAAVRPTVLSNDHYDLFGGRPFGQLEENVRGLAEVARESQLPFWGIILSTGHGPFVEPTEGELRWQIGTWLSYGARGIGWFTYWTPSGDSTFKDALVDTAGVPTRRYELARRINPETRAVGELLAGTTWRKTLYSGGTPRYGDPFVPDGTLAEAFGRAAIGTFSGGLGTEFLLVVNRDSVEAQRIELTPARPGRRSEIFVPASGTWSEAPRLGGRIDLALEAGAFVLLRLSPRHPAPRASGLTLDLWPNPARGLLAVHASGAAPGARVSIRDVRGRLVHGLRQSGGELRWDGARDDGRRAAPGIYFVRLESGGEALSRRFLWLPPVPPGGQE